MVPSKNTLAAATLVLLSKVQVSAPKSSSVPGSARKVVVPGVRHRYDLILMKLGVSPLPQDLIHDGGAGPSDPPFGRTRLEVLTAGVVAAFIASELLLRMFASVQALSLDAVLARNGVSEPLMSGDPPRART